MNKNQISQGTHASVPFATTRQLSWARLFFVALFLALSLAHQQPKTCAEVTRPTLPASSVALTSDQPRSAARNATNCEQLLVECLANGGGAAACGRQYDACIEGGPKPIETTEIDLSDIDQIWRSYSRAIDLRAGNDRRERRLQSIGARQWHLGPEDAHASL